MSVVWDLGGTLVDTYSEVDTMLLNAIRTAGHEFSLDKVALLTRVSIEEAMAAISQRFNIPLSTLNTSYEELKESWKEHPAPLMGGALETMKLVHSLGGMNIIVTHRDRVSAVTLSEQLGIDADALVCAPDGFARKPNPEMYHYVCETYQIDPAHCLAVGDRDIDVSAASAAGLRTALLQTPGLSTHSLATWTVSSLGELTSIIREVLTQAK